ncbi:MAG: hypothetical protein H0U65_00535 [Rubrobacter sp.]|jgi:alkylhydroperoxidase family enzyme|nr:hypothetical protein [Rubrobacter sp.]
MARTKAVDPNDAPSGAEDLLEAGRKQAGGDINFFKQMAASPTSLKAYMDFAGTMQGGALDRGTQEAIAVGVSDFNGCKY